MIAGGKQIQKFQRTKYKKKDEDIETFKEVRKKHRDKSMYRMIKQDEKYER
jgi:hypothetical protein